MKKVLIIIVLFIIVLAGCNNENCAGSSDDEYHFSAKVGQEYWEGECYLDFANEDKQNLFLVPESQENYLRIMIDFEGVGEYVISDSSAVLTETIGGDVLIGEYYAIGNNNSKLIIDKYDAVEGIVGGRFDFKIRKQSSIIDVKEGEFSANFINVN